MSHLENISFSAQMNKPWNLYASRGH